MKSMIFVIWCLMVVFSFGVFAETTKNVKVLGKFKDWNIYRITEGTKSLCYIGSFPVKSTTESKEKKERKGVYILITAFDEGAEEFSTSAGQKVHGITVRVDQADPIDLYHEEEMGWVLDGATDKTLIALMRKGRTMVVQSIASEDQKAFYDHYSLMGFGAAYEEMHRSCLK